MKNDPNNKAQKQNVGNAGEYYIAARLSALNFVATITLGRAEKYDILALSPSGRLVKISVKATQRDNAKDFPLSNKDESGAADDFYYAFVKLNGFAKEPDFWVIPSKVVCSVVSSSHKKFLDSGNKDNSIRLLPIQLTRGTKLLFPENWEEDVKKYHKNLEQLL
jgi:hypothetical protein